jgi:uncharacterized protein (DUF2267 family)
MTTPERTMARVRLLAQLVQVRQQARSTSAMGANFLLGVCVGTLMNLRRLMPKEEVAQLARQVKAEFGELWPDTNPDFIALLDQMIPQPPEGPPHE